MKRQKLPVQAPAVIIFTAKIFVLVFLIISCRVTMVAPYEEKIAQQIHEIAMKVDRLYLIMLETTDNVNNERAYIKFAENYVDIEVELNSLLNRNRMRPLNKESTRNCEIALETWIKYKEKHKQDDVINDFDIELNRDYLRDLFMVIEIGEEAKSIIR